MFAEGGLTVSGLPNACGRRMLAVSTVVQEPYHAQNAQPLTPGLPTGKPPEEQWSAFPEVASDPGVVWRKGAFKEDGVALEVVRWEEGAVTRDLWGRCETQA